MYDLLLKNGRLIDPSQNLDSVMDVAFTDGHVAELGKNITGTAAATRDVSGAIVTPGLIDLHTHVYWGGTSIGVDPDALALQSGCTTLVDAGTAGPANLAGMRRHIIEPATARVLVYINASFAGIFAFSKAVMVGECTDIRLLNARECVRVAREHQDIVVGVKVRVGQTASGSNGIAPMDIALEIAEELELPVMAHLDFPPPSRKQVIERLRPGDVLTHCFRPFPNAPVRGSGRIFDEVLAARERGVIFDIGHGMGSFGFTTAKAMLENHFLPDVISSDVHSLSIEGPAIDLSYTMSKFLCLGMSLNDVVSATTQAPARAIRREDLGTLRPGGTGDATVLTLHEGAFDYTDALGETIKGDKQLRSAGMVRNGHWWAAAGD
jgi:dihydroorotase